jgi:hypothetical protein
VANDCSLYDEPKKAADSSNEPQGQNILQDNKNNLGYSSYKYHRNLKKQKKQNGFNKEIR